MLGANGARCDEVADWRDSFHGTGCVDFDGPGSERERSRRECDGPGGRGKEDEDVNIVTTRFGLMTALEADLVRFPEGLVGFRSLTRFVLLPDAQVAGLVWLQSAEVADVAFALISPSWAVPDYQVELRPGDRASLELSDDQAARVFVILNRTESGGLTVNLQGPVVLNPSRRLGRQLVLTSSRYAVRYSLDGMPTSPGIPGRSVALRATA